MAENKNSIMDIKHYLARDEKHPPTMAEFNDFWKALSEEEKDEFKKTELPK